MKNILLYKLVLFNSLIAAWAIGMDTVSNRINATVSADTTGIVWLIIGLFAVTMAGAFSFAWRLNKRHNIFHTENFTLGDVMDKVDYEGVMWEKDSEWIAYSGGWLLFLGLIGTLLGLQISLEGVNTGNLNNIEGIKALAVQMVAGLRIELSATIVGAALCMLTEMNYVMIRKVASRVAHMENLAARQLGGAL
jgi:uncharacterized membrane protein